MRKVTDKTAITIDTFYVTFVNYSDVGWDVAFGSCDDPRRDEETREYERLADIIKDFGKNNVEVREYTASKDTPYSVLGLSFL